MRKMRTVIQRVRKASVSVAGKTVSSIGNGLLLLLGIEAADTEEDAQWLCRKVLGLRIFDDEAGVMNRSVMDINGEIIVVSQFTLFASYKKGNRPSWLRAAGHEHAVPMYERMVELLSQGLGKQVGTGVFGAEMQVELINDGPVTICMDTKDKE
jgi:D-tyrosyl-tRNA(Tyr) deacylase